MFKCVSLSTYLVTVTDQRFSIKILVSNEFTNYLLLYFKYYFILYTAVGFVYLDLYSSRVQQYVQSMLLIARIPSLKCC